MDYAEAAFLASDLLLRPVFSLLLVRAVRRPGLRPVGP